MFYGAKIVSIGFTSKKKIDCIIYTSPTLLKGGRTGRDFSPSYTTEDNPKGCLLLSGKRGSNPRCKQRSHYLNLPDPPKRRENGPRLLAIIYNRRQPERLSSVER